MRELLPTPRLSSGLSEALEKIKVNINAIGLYGRTALHFAVIDGNYEIVSALVHDYSAVTNVIDEFLRTPLDYAYQERRYIMIDLLLPHRIGYYTMIRK